MFTCPRILFPVDFSERSLRAIPMVKAMAERFGSEVTLLHVVEPAVDALTGAGMADLEAWVDQRKAELDLFGGEQWGSTRLVRAVEAGDPAARIASAVEDLRPGLVMTPTHGYGVFRRWLLGSVTAKLLHDIRAPIWTDAHLEQAPLPRQAGLRRILCALNLEDPSLNILRWAEEFARTCNAELRLVHAMPAAEHIPGQPDEPFCLFLREVASQRLEQLQQKAGSRLPATTLGGDVSGSIAGLAKDWSADLIIAGRGRSRTHAYAIIRDAPCPVVTV